MPPRYHINIFWSDEDGCWIADVPDLRGSTRGRTPKEAAAEAQEAIALSLETARDEGIAIPEHAISRLPRRTGKAVWGSRKVRAGAGAEGPGFGIVSSGMLSQATLLTPGREGAGGTEADGLSRRSV